MNVIVDTNVVAYYLLGTDPFAEECSAFWKRASKTSAPALWHAEIMNVLWMAIRKKVVTLENGIEKLRLAGSLGIHAVPTRYLWRGALVRATHSGISAYDSLFVELAARRNLRLATFDSSLLRTFPEIARRPSACV